MAGKVEISGKKGSVPTGMVVALVVPRNALPAVVGVVAAVAVAVAAAAAAAAVVATGPGAAVEVLLAVGVGLVLGSASVLLVVDGNTPTALVLGADVVLGVPREAVEGVVAVAAGVGVVSMVVVAAVVAVATVVVTVVVVAAVVVTVAKVVVKVVVKGMHVPFSCSPLFRATSSV